MIKSTVKPKILIITLVLGFLAVASTSFACSNCGGGHGSVSAYSSASLTSEQQQQLDEIQTSLNSKTEEYRSASANDSTTVGTLRTLETEISDLKEQYWTVLGKPNHKTNGSIAGGNGPWLRCGSNGCNHQSHRDSMGQDQHMGQGHMNRMAGHMGGCWRN